MKHIVKILILFMLCSANATAQRKKTEPKKPAAPKLTEQGLKAKQLFEEMLPNTQRVFVVDSIVVGQDSVLSAIPLPQGNGRIVAYNDFFSTESQPGAYVFVNGFGNRCYYSEADASGHMKLYRRDRLGKSWGEAQLLEGLGDELTDMNYPFMASDGTTLYFSAKSEDTALGGYDIYVSSYDAEEGVFMKAENLGLPFNSTADDYFYIVDEDDSLAWFATSRRQLDGKACVYTFVPSATRQNYDEDEIDDDKQLQDLANLTRIRSTWPTPELRDEAATRLEGLKKMQAKSQRKSGMRFVVNDQVVYTDASQFSSQATKQAYTAIVAKQKAIAEGEESLQELRKQYLAGSTTARRKLQTEIKKDEQRLETLREEVAEAIKRLRERENSAISKH